MIQEWKQRKWKDSKQKLIKWKTNQIDLINKIKVDSLREKKKKHPLTSGLPVKKNREITKIWMILLNKDEIKYFPEKLNYQHWLKKGKKIWIAQYL